MPVSQVLFAVVLAMITSGLTSAVSHEVTLLAPGLLMLALMAINYQNRQGPVRQIWLIVPTVLILVAMISTQANSGKLPSLIHAMSMFVPLYGLAIVPRSGQRMLLLYTTLTGMIVIGFVSWALLNAEELHAWSVEGMSGCGNLLACQINMLIPFLILAHHRAVGSERNLYLTVILCGATCVLFLMSRNGIAALFGNLTLLFFFKRRRTAIALSLCIFALVQFRPQVFSTEAIRSVLKQYRFTEWEASYSRRLIWEESFAAWQKRPLTGVGPGNADRALSHIQMNHAHNNVIQVGLEMGLFSAITVLGFSAYAAWIAVRLVLRARDDILIGLPVLAYLVYASTASPIQHSEMTMLLVLCLNNGRARLASETQTVEVPALSRSVGWHGPAEFTWDDMAEIRS